MPAAADGTQPWGVRPNLLAVGDTLLLSTGRPGLFVYASYNNNGRSWVSFNLAAAHNAGTTAGSAKFSPTCVSASLQGPSEAESTAYTTLVAGVGGSDAVVCYDQLARGWMGPAATQHDAVYCMPLWVARDAIATEKGEPALKHDDHSSPRCAS